jgi:hypothetical protein
VVHHEADRARAGGEDHQRVDEAHVVADEHRGALLRDVLEAALLQPVHRVHQQPAEEAHQELGHQRVDVRRDGGVHEAHDQEELRQGEAGVSSAFAISDATIMKSALRMLLAAMMRARVGFERAWICA